VLQDDFLPRVSTQSVKRLFLTTFALYAFLHIARSVFDISGCCNFLVEVSCNFQP
jgi:hypothetical protein